jgi:hypothetical protein
MSKKAFKKFAGNVDLHSVLDDLNLYARETLRLIELVRSANEGLTTEESMQDVQRILDEASRSLVQLTHCAFLVEEE